MNISQIVKPVKDLFNRNDSPGMDPNDSDLEPLQILNDLNDFFNEKGIGPEYDPKTLMRHFQIARFLCKFLKPMQFFEDKFSFPFRLGLEIMTSQSMTPEILTAISPGFQLYNDYVKNALQGSQNSDMPIVWLVWCLCSDIIVAFDAQPFCTEGLAVLPMPIGPGPTEKLIDIAEQAGVPPEFCSSSKNALGACLADQLPKPACMVTSSHPCDSMVSSYQLLEYLTDYPIFRLDTPNWSDGRSISYYVEDMKQLIRFLEKHLNRKLDYERLREVLNESNRTNELLSEINEMRRARPCPISFMPQMMNWFFRLLGMGKPEVTETTARLHAVCKNNFLSGKGAIRSEKIRVIWYDVPISFYPLALWMEETFGAVIVIDLLNYINTPVVDTSSPETMIRGLADENMNLTMVRQFHGQLELLERDLERVCRDYEGDCFIYTGHVGCKHGWALTRHLKDFTKKMGLPLLILTSDIFDQRVTDLNQIKTQIEEFFVTNRLV